MSESSKEDIRRLIVHHRDCLRSQISGFKKNGSNVALMTVGQILVGVLPKVDYQGSKKQILEKEL